MAVKANYAASQTASCATCTHARACSVTDMGSLPRAGYNTCTEVGKKGCPHQVVRDIRSKDLLGEAKQSVCILDNRADLACCEDSIGTNKL